jgi:hypothetical protein
MISTDCGNNWKLIRAFTALNGLSNLLTPFTADLSAYAGQNCLIAFQATDGNINNPQDYELHLDSIRMGALTVSVGKEVRQKDISLYPNPCSGDRLCIKNSSPGENIRFFSASGIEYFPSLISNENGCYDVKSMPPGFYFMRSNRITLPFVLMR